MSLSTNYDFIIAMSARVGRAKRNPPYPVLSGHFQRNLVTSARPEQPVGPAAAAVPGQSGPLGERAAPWPGLRGRSARAGPAGRRQWRARRPGRGPLPAGSWVRPWRGLRKPLVRRWREHRGRGRTRACASSRRRDPDGARRHNPSRAGEGRRLRLRARPRGRPGPPRARSRRTDESKRISWCFSCFDRSTRTERNEAGGETARRDVVPEGSRPSPIRCLASIPGHASDIRVGFS